MSQSLLTDLIDNAVLTFTISTGFSGGYDPITGNPLFGTTTLTVRAKLDQKKDAPRDVERPQNSNLKSFWVEGYCCDPATLPDSIAKDAVCDCAIARFGTGRLHLVPRMPLAAMVALDLEDLTGQKIQGWFESQ